MVLLGLFLNPVYAELSSLEVNKDSFLKNDQIIFSGTVEKDSSGLVTIVIRDLNDKFVLLTQAIINHDNTFEKSLIIKDRFTEHGIYSANGFILNMTKGVSTEFSVSLDGIPINNVEVNYEEELEVKDQIIKKIPLEIQEPIQMDTKTNYANFVDSSKDPDHYIERYYSEPTYKSWFDRNYPDLTIEEAVGYTDTIVEIKSSVQEIIDNEIIPEAQASSIVDTRQNITNNSDIAQISLAIAGLGILFGAVYGVKRQVDSNSRQISLNKNIIMKKIIHPIRGSNPKEILQTRLAKGEITLEEFEILEKKLKWSLVRDFNTVF